MPTREAHQKQAAHNREMLAQVTGAYPDWYVTVCFYVCVHCLEACLAERGLHSETHGERSARLGRAFRGTATFERMGVYAAYRRLYRSSVLARYACRVPTEGECRAALRDMENVEQYAQWRLGAV